MGEVHHLVGLLRDLKSNPTATTPWGRLRGRVSAPTHLPQTAGGHLSLVPVRNIPRLDSLVWHYEVAIVYGLISVSFHSPINHFNRPILTTCCLIKPLSCHITADFIEAHVLFGVVDLTWIKRIIRISPSKTLISCSFKNSIDSFSPWVSMLLLCHCNITTTTSYV